MKLLVSFLLLMATAVQLNAQNSKAVVGIWFNAEKDAQIQIYEANGKFYGKLVWLREPYEADGKTTRRDLKNSDEKLRNRSLLNVVILNDFIFENDKWTKGQIYDPKTGKTYKSEMKMNGNNLDVRGYIGTPMLGRITTFSRVK